MGISLLEPVSLAMGRAGKVLFRPFDFTKWITLGFCAWLAGLGEGSASFNLRSRFPLNAGPGAPGPGPNAVPGRVGGAGANNDFDFKPIWDWVQSNLGLVVVIASVVVVFSIALWLVFSWLKARGTFMFLDGVVRDRGAVSEPWREYAREGNSVFRFLIAFSVVMFVLCFLVSAGAIAMASPDIKAGRFGGQLKTALVVFVPLLFLLVFSGAVVSVFLKDFVVPIMYVRRTGVMSAWGEFGRSILAGHVGTMILYLLMRLLIGIVCGIIAVATTCATCCIAGLPYVGTVILLPLAVFERSYSLYVLEQYGADWRIMRDGAKPKEMIFEDLPPFPG